MSRFEKFTTNELEDMQPYLSHPLRDELILELIKRREDSYREKEERNKRRIRNALTEIKSALSSLSDEDSYVEITKIVRKYEAVREI